MPKSLSIEQVLRLRPSIVIIIRWNSSVGQPRGDWCSGFQILVEERTPTTFVDKGGGLYEPRPGRWKLVTDSPACRPHSAEGEGPGVTAHAAGLHLNMFPDGCYRITPTLRGAWSPSGLFAALFNRRIEPASAQVMLKDGNPIQTVEFEVIRTPIFRWWISR